MSGCPSFPKIETLFNRDEKFHVNTDRLRCPEFGMIKSWLITEKIDGTNIRVSLERNFPDWGIRFYGRTEKAQVPTFLLAHLQDTFSRGGLKKLWRDGGDYSITLYGEGYGARIQKGGGNYREGVSFRLFDVLVDGKWWLGWENVCDVAEKLGIKTVPLVSRGGILGGIVELVRGGFGSHVTMEEREGCDHKAEGIVARTDPDLFDKHGRPLRFKLKTKDFAHEGEAHA